MANTSRVPVVSSLIIIAVIAFALIYLWMMYNSLVTARVRIKEAWSGIEVQLKFSVFNLVQKQKP